MIDVARAPQALENIVGKAQGQQVLHGLLAEVVIDAENLRLVKILHQRAIYFERTRQIVADRFFDDDPREVRRARLRYQARLGQPLDRSPIASGGIAR